MVLDPASANPSLAVSSKNDDPLDQLVWRLITSIHQDTGRHRSHEKPRRSIALRSQLSLTSLLVAYPTDEELVAEVSEDLLLWHERRGRILYGLLRSETKSPPSIQATPVLTPHRNQERRRRSETRVREREETCSLVKRGEEARRLEAFSSFRNATSFPSLSIEAFPSRISVSRSSPGLKSLSSRLSHVSSPSIDPGKLHVTVVGNGAQPVLTIHGMLSSANFFTEGLIPRISPSFLEDICTFYIPDMMGYGRSVRILANENYNAAEQACRIYCDVVRHFSLGSYHLLGHSFGGMVAVALAAIAPQNVRTLTLLSPSYFESVQVAKQVMQNTPVPARYISTWNPDIGRRLLQVIRTCLSPLVPTIASFVPSTTLSESTLRELVSTEPEATLGTVETMKYDRMDGWLTLLRQHQLRILLLQADHDIIVPKQQGRKMAFKYPNVVYRELPGTGHFFPQSDSSLLASIFEHEILRWTSRHKKKLGDWIIS